MSQKIDRILWAVDFLSEQPELEKQALKFIKVLNKKLEATVQPVFVTNNHPMQNQYMDEILKHIEKRFKKYKSIHLNAPISIGQNIGANPELREQVDALLSYAQMENFDLIVTQTHASSGIKKWLLGSFAESLILHSRIPVMSINPSSEAPRSIKNIMYPFELGDVDKPEFGQVLRLAKQLNSKITLYHRLPTPSHYLGPYAHLLQEEFRLDKNEAEETAEEYEKMAKAQDIKTETVIETKKARISDALLKAAKKYEADLIAVVSKKDTTGRLLLGSTGLDVVRKSPQPVWIVHENR